MKSAKTRFSIILSRTRLSVFLPVITFAWGSIAALIGAVRHQSQLIALRFLLGVFEAGFSVSDSMDVINPLLNLIKPAVIFLISTWYRKNEQ